LISTKYHLSETSVIIGFSVVFEKLRETWLRDPKGR